MSLSKDKQQHYLKQLLKLIKKPSFLAFVFFTFLAIVMTFPLILRMNQIVGSAGGDGTYFVWLVRWYQKALFELNISPFFSPYLNFPQGWNLASTDITPAMVALALPASMVFGSTWGYNFAMLLSFILSGWGMYLWIRHLTGDELAGLVSGTIFGFLPFHMAHYVVGHLSLAGTQWFPFYFWGLYDLLRQEQFRWRPVLMAGISAGLIGATSSYYVYMTILLSGVFVVGYLLFKGYKRLKERVFWKGMLLFGVLSGVLVGLAMLPYLDFNSQDGLASHAAEYVSEYSASPTDFVIPSIWHFLWGGWVDKSFNPEYWQEATLYIGLVALVLAVYGWLRRRQTGQSQLVNIAILVALAGFILALGIDLHWLGQKVTILSGKLTLVSDSSIGPQIYLPSYYLYKYLPLFSKMRVMMRFGLFTLIFTSMLAGLGAHAILKGMSGKVRQWVGIGLLVLVFIDFYPGEFKQFSTLGARAVDGWLASQPENGAVAQFPFSQESDQGQVYNTLVHQKPFLGGFFNANHPEQYARIQPILQKFPTSESIDLLYELGVEYVVVDSSAYLNYPKVDQNIREYGLVLVNVSQSEYVYRLP